MKHNSKLFLSFRDQILNTIYEHNSKLSLNCHHSSRETKDITNMFILSSDFKPLLSSSFSIYGEVCSRCEKIYSINVFGLDYSTFHLKKRFYTHDMLTIDAQNQYYSSILLTKPSNKFYTLGYHQMSTSVDAPITGQYIQISMNIIRPFPKFHIADIGLFYWIKTVNLSPIEQQILHDELNVIISSLNDMKPIPLSGVINISFHPIPSFSNPYTYMKEILNNLLLNHLVLTDKHILPSTDPLYDSEIR